MSFDVQLETISDKHKSFFYSISTYASTSSVRGNNFKFLHYIVEKSG